MKRIECIIMDWAGSAVDYGCFAPVAAFLKAFNEIGINITMEQARRPMGMAKIDHIRELFKMGGVGEEFEKLYHRPWNEQDVTDMNAKFEEYLFASLANYTDPIPGVIDTLNELRKQGIKIGSTTGYTQAMMDVVLPNAARKGYTTDKCVTPNDLPAGRPFPYMIYQNMIDLPTFVCLFNLRYHAVNLHFYLSLSNFLICKLQYNDCDIIFSPKTHSHLKQFMCSFFNITAHCETFQNHFRRTHVVKSITAQ